ncbi:glycosyltransferase family 2 protein [Oscillibacter valericigenes]|nr:glycosyltransferase family 2 protein [Oscillibacter valericigenes]
MLDTWIVILTLLLKAASLWFLAVALFALKKPRPYARCAPRTRFACLVAARNEEAVIGALVESLREQDYPNALYDIFVIPNNCTDNTEAAALTAGAKIFRCFEPVCCKGDALHEAVAWLLPRGYDAFCVFDADNVADAQFLARMNDAFCAGAQVCKGAMRVKNPYDSWLSGCYGLYFTLFDTFFSRARMSCGLSSKLVGTGFAVHRAVLERFGGWNTSTIAEDAEFAALCAANGVRVCFVPNALTYDEAPNDFEVSLRQRRRWCSGIMDAAVKMDAALAAALRGSAPLRALDSLLIVNAPFLQALMLLPLTLTLISALMGGTLPSLVLSGALSLAASTLGLMAFAALLAVLGGYRDRRIIRTIMGFPLFMAAWLPIQIVSLVSRTRSWQPIVHSRALSVESARAA